MKYHVPNVVISSIPLESWLAEALPLSIRPTNNSGAYEPHLLCIASSFSTASATLNGRVLHPTQLVVHAQCVPLIPGYFSGVGDLFSALLLAHFHPAKSPETLHASPLSAAVSQALSKTHAILVMTQAVAQALPEAERLPSDDELDVEDPMRKIRRMRGRELALVRGQDLIRGHGITHVREMILWEGFGDFK